MKIGKYTLHLHAIAVHFTNGLYPVAVFFLIIYKIFGYEPFSSTYFHLLLTASLSVPISFLSGFIEWKKKYKGARVKIFIRKYTCGLILMGMGLFCSVWTIISPEIITGSGILPSVFVFLNFVILSLVTYLGYLGGKLVFGGSH